MSELKRPESVTDELIDQLTSMIAASDGATYKHVEVYTGETFADLPAVDPGRRRAGVRRGARRRRRSGPRGR